MDQQHNTDLGVGATRGYDVLGVRVCQISNAMEALKVEAWKLEGRMGTKPDPKRRAILLALRSGLERNYTALVKMCGGSREKGVDPMAKKVEKTTIMCKVCGTNYTGFTEDNRVEPLAELCPRCEAHVLGIKPSPAAVKNAKGNKAPKGLIDELKKSLSKIEQGNLFKRVEYVAAFKARPNGVNGNGRHVPLATKKKETTVTQATKTKAPKKKNAPKKKANKATAAPVVGARGKPITSKEPYYVSFSGFDKSQMSTLAFRVARMAYIKERKGGQLARLKSQARELHTEGKKKELAKLNKRIVKIQAEKEAAVKTYNKIIKDHPEWKPFVQAAEEALSSGKPFSKVWNGLSAKMRTELSATATAKPAKKKTPAKKAKAAPKPKKKTKAKGKGNAKKKAKRALAA